MLIPTVDTKGMTHLKDQVVSSPNWTL